jgi:hypothetical protein
MPKTKQEKPTKLTRKDIEAEFAELVQGSEVVFVDSEPELTGDEYQNVTHVVYLLMADNTLSVWARGPVAAGEFRWTRIKEGIAPDRTSAKAHYDALKWQLFMKADRKERKLNNTPIDRDNLRRAVRYFYDLQKLRIQSGNRDSDQAEPAVLEEDDKTFFGRQSVGLNTLEKSCLAEIESILNKVPIYNAWLKEQKGCGPTMAGVIVAEIDIAKGHKEVEEINAEIAKLDEELLTTYRSPEARNIRKQIVELETELDGTFDVRKCEMLGSKIDQLEKKLIDELGEDKVADFESRLNELKAKRDAIKPCDTISALWAYAGLAVDPETGQAVRRKVGVKSNWNPFLKAKMVFVLGGCLLKANSPWRRFYDNYRHRKENQRVSVCMLCNGEGALKEVDKKQVPCKPDTKGAQACYNCEGKCRNVPWGRGDKHRHQAALRYMVKQFLAELWVKWRELEGLPVTEPYSVAKLGIRHGDHATAPAE